ncbi:hypothetical protein [Dactylosporangium salmoneum]|uniref:DUF4129 domain-containing protein n=1 Tax=Dactylosporangium salmoneum TaxID=53361 RepID=A0ABN3GS31_9ACTN
MTAVVPPDEPRLTLAEQGFWSGWGRWVFVLVAAAGDVTNFRVVVAELDGELQEYQVWLLVAAFTALAIGLTHIAGAALRGAGGGGRPGSARVVVAVVLAVLWLALGAAALWIRLTHGAAGGDQLAGLDPADPLAGLDGGAPAAPAGGVPAANLDGLPMAVLFLLLYLGGGLMAFWLAWDHGPDRIAMLGRHRRLGRAERREHGRQLRSIAWAWTFGLPVTLRRRYRLWRGPQPWAYRRARSRHQRATADADRLRRLIEHARADAGRDPERREAQRAGTFAQADEFKQLARVALATRVGSPAGTSAITHQQPATPHR